MSMATLEKAVLDELREVTGKPRLRKKDITEWTTGPVTPQEGETFVYLPKLQINVCYKI